MQSHSSRRANAHCNTSKHFRCLPSKPGPSLSLESYVYNILYEVLIPEPGRSIRIYLPPEEAHLSPIATILQRPSLVDELPLMDFPIRLLFSYLGVECVIQLFTCVLLENQVLLRSADYQKLMIVGETITSLLFPFVWPHVYAPILPAALHHFLDAPVPFVMGLHSDSESYLKIGNEATLCCVDIDKRTIQLPEEQPQFPHRNEFIAEIISTLDKFHVNHQKNNSQHHQPNVMSSLLPKSGNVKRTGMVANDVMTSSCTLPSGVNARRKHSLNEMLDWDRPLITMQPQHTYGDYMSNPSTQKFMSNGLGERMSGASALPPLPPRNDAFQRISRRTGVGIDGDYSNDVMPTIQKTSLSLHEQYCEDLRLNNWIREIFLNRFVQMFVTYESYVILPNQNKDEWLTNRETLQNFDKASFLSDQQHDHRPFLSRFLESQMFATLIDNKIMAMWDNDYDRNLKLFDYRIRILK